MSQGDDLRARGVDVRGTSEVETWAFVVARRFQRFLAGPARVREDAAKFKKSLPRSSL